MRIRCLLSPTAFKSTLSPGRAAQIMRAVIKKQNPHWIVQCLPIADGGDGTLDVLSLALRARTKRSQVTGPLGKKVWARWAVAPKGPLVPEKTAIIEMARASGLALVSGKNKIMEATTYGTGELIQAALTSGCRRIVMGVGGTATGEGGIGALQALGLKYFDKHHQSLSGSPQNLLKIKEINWSQLDPRLRNVKIFVVCDVTNPLLGPHGSARTFGPQKGATPKQVEQLEKGLRHWARFAKFQTKNHSGAGAAGALAYGLSAFLGAQLVRGSPFIFKMLNWKKSAKKADVIISGEGQLDQTSFSGKAIGEMRPQNAR